MESDKPRPGTLVPKCPIRTDEKEIGWGKTIQETLAKYDLPTSLKTIKTIRKNEWTNKVKAVIEKRNTERLIQDCYKIEAKTKGNDDEKHRLN